VGFIKKLAILALKLHRALADRRYDLVAISSEVFSLLAKRRALTTAQDFLPGFSGLVP
jgi:hypothetical protein